MVEPLQQQEATSIPASPVANKLGGVFRHLAGACLLGIFLVMLVGTIMRYVPGTSYLQASIPGVTILLQVWMVFLGSVAAVATASHLRFSLFVDWMPGVLRVTVRTGIWLIRIATMVVFLIASKNTVMTGFDASIGGVAFTKGVVYLALPVALVTMLVLEGLLLHSRIRTRAQS